MIKENSFENKLEKVIKFLPELEHKNNLWNRIEAQLDFEKGVKNGIINLSEFDFETNNWAKIEKRLNDEKSPVTKIKIRKLLVYSLSAAAVIAIIIGLSGVINKNNGGGIITYSTEQIVENEFIEIDEDIDLNPLKFLEKNCQTKVNVCNSPEFKEQKAALAEIEIERLRISETIETYGESPELVKSLIKIENLKSKILKDLIKTLNS